jgi:hypothetical protein
MKCRDGQALSDGRCLQGVHLPPETQERSRIQNSRIIELAPPATKNRNKASCINGEVNRLFGNRAGEFGKKSCSCRFHPPLKKGGWGDFPDVTLQSPT